MLFGDGLVPAEGVVPQHGDSESEENWILEAGPLMDWVEVKNTCVWVIGVVSVSVESAEVHWFLLLVCDVPVNVILEEFLPGSRFLHLRTHRWSTYYNFKITEFICLTLPIINLWEWMAKIFSEVALPADFAQKLLDCEIEVELNDIVPKNVVMSIFQLYSKGIEYFESIRCYKYMYFERKMGSLLRCPKIINSMSDHPHNEHQGPTVKPSKHSK